MRKNLQEKQIQGAKYYLLPDVFECFILDMLKCFPSTFMQINFIIRKKYLKKTSLYPFP